MKKVTIRPNIKFRLIYIFCAVSYGILYRCKILSKKILHRCNTLCLRKKKYTVINEEIIYVILTILFRVTFVTVSEKIFFVRRWRAQTKYASLEIFLNCLFYIFF